MMFLNLLYNKHISTCTINTTLFINRCAILVCFINRTFLMGFFPDNVAVNSVSFVKLKQYTPVVLMQRCDNTTTMMWWRDDAMTIVRWHDETIARWRDGAISMTQWCNSEDAMLIAGQRLVFIALASSFHCNIALLTVFSHAQLEREMAWGSQCVNRLYQKSSILGW